MNTTNKVCWPRSWFRPHELEQVDRRLLREAAEEHGWGHVLRRLVRGEEVREAWQRIHKP